MYELDVEKSGLGQEADFENVDMDDWVINDERNAERNAEEDHVKPKEPFHEDLCGLELAVNNLLSRLCLVKLEVL